MHVYYKIEECVQQDPQCEGVDHYCTKSSVTFSSPLDPIDRLLYTPFTTSKHCKKLLLSRLVHLLTFTQMKQITSQVGGPAHSLTTPTPHSIVEIVYNEEKERRFVEAASEYGTFLAYHGSRVENFYSIIHNGLLNHMNKVYCTLSHCVSSSHCCM